MTIPDALATDARQRQYRFRDFILDLDSGFLRRNGQEIPLRPKAFEVLRYLVMHPGTLVSKNELVDAVWPNAAVTDNSLSQCLFEIRRAIDDEAHPMIRTVARRGYVFDATVSTAIASMPIRAANVPTAVPLISETIRRAKWFKLIPLVAATLTAIIVSVGYVAWSARDVPLRLVFTPLTNFTDSAMAPAVSRDGRMVAFIRGDSAFLTPGQIWVKLLPSGDPVQLTNLRGNKYGPAFSSDGARITFTMAGSVPGWQTFTVPTLGGRPPELMLPNAAGVTWLDDDRILFSEIRTGMHMGIVTSRVNRADRREIYFPVHERAMAHYSSPSPDGRSVLIVEMSDISAWLPCRLVPFDGSAPSRQVGPLGGCGAAAWSPDGRWMYFSVEIDGQRHLWRQRFPEGELEQITFGPNEEDGVAVFPDGSLVTSVGMSDSAVWIRDAHGERAITSSGTASPNVKQGISTRPVFSADGQYLYYLLRNDSRASSTDLWRYHMSSAHHEAVLTGFAIDDYDVANDGSEVVFSTQPVGMPSELWLARLDRQVPPQRIAATGEQAPHFGGRGEIVFKLSDGKANYIGRMNRDGSGRTKVVPYSISSLQAISPDRKWLVVFAPLTISPDRNAPDRGNGMASFAVPLDGGPSKRLCAGFCIPQWAPDGRHLYIMVGAPARTDPATAIVIPLELGQTLPTIPDGGIRSAEVARIPGAYLRDGGSVNADLRVRGFSPSADVATIAYVKTNVHHNLFQVHLR